MASMLHRFGELALPLETVRKSFIKMDRWEWELYQQYPIISASFIKPEHKKLKQMISSHRLVSPGEACSRPFTTQILAVATEYLELTHLEGKGDQRKIHAFFENSKGQRYNESVVDIVLQQAEEMRL